MSLEQLTPEEIAKVRSLLMQDDRIQWFWASVRRWAAGAAAIAAAAVAFRQDLASLFSWVFRGPQ